MCVYIYIHMHVCVGMSVCIYVLCVCHSEQEVKTQPATKLEKDQAKPVHTKLEKNQAKRVCKEEPLRCQPVEPSSPPAAMHDVYMIIDDSDSEMPAATTVT